MGRGRGGRGWGRKGRAGLRAPPARYPGALAAAGALVAGLRGQGDRSAPLWAVSTRPRTPAGPYAPAPPPPPPRYRAPGRAAPHPASPPQPRALIETGG